MFVVSVACICLLVFGVMEQKKNAARAQNMQISVL